MVPYGDIPMGHVTTLAGRGTSAEMRQRMAWEAEAYAMSIAKALRIWAGTGTFSAWPSLETWSHHRGPYGAKDIGEVPKSVFISLLNVESEIWRAQFPQQIVSGSMLYKFVVG